MDSAIAIAVLGAILAVYLLPALIAGRTHPHRLAIFVINLLFGWTLVVWVGCLAWAVIQRPRGPGRTARERTIVGKAFVTDGDGIRVSGREIRFAGLDAPEWNQPAQHRDGYWFAHGKRVKSALIREIGGRYVHVVVEDYDRFGRAVGVVICEGRDIGEWLVREGHAIAAYSDRYEHVERAARSAGRGLWNHKVNIDPRKWRHRNMRQR